MDKLDVNRFLATSNSLNIADLGNSVGFMVVKNIVESMKRKIPQNKQDKVQFQVFFNDHVRNCFDTLFKSLPPNREYFAAGVPGSIHGRLFPKGTLHFVNSSYALHWLSSIPNELIDKKSPAFNKGKIFYTDSCNEVVQVYAKQFARDMEVFLNARAEELVPGGLMTLLLPCFEVKKYPLVQVVDLLGDCLMVMAEKGLLSEEKLDSFNFPRYNATPKEIEDVIRKNDRFTVEKFQSLGPPSSFVNKPPNIYMFMLFLQTSWGWLIEKHFGSEVVEQVFCLLRKRIVTSSVLTLENIKTVSECFILLRRKAT
uniref:loganic acid O-methyltransferase-like n=1 Tax=Erigeron canadensis TaxID=72917 RepID=UPI001CB91FCA|nr:loganic acid O-methyltransferase-like [Erigeron canadensis]